jgi:hypothetical protein
MLDGNYSTLNKLTKVFAPDEVSGFSSRIITKILFGQYAAGITVGDVIHFDTIANQFVRSMANDSANAEVFGIVETVGSDLALNVVTNGSITIPANRLVNITGSNTGGNDIYFLSGTSSGFLQNCGPTFPEMIIKPIYYIAPHGSFTGLVRNYLGYVNGRMIQNSDPSNLLALKVINVSDDLSKILLFNTNTSTLSVRSLTFTGLFSTTQIHSSALSSVVIDPGLDLVDFNANSNYEGKVSNDGNTILLFAKHTNKVYCISVSGSTYRLKSIINVDIAGSPEDKLWAADDELTSMVVSTRSLNRAPSTNDCRHVTPSISSKIKYYRRSVNNITTFKHRWKKCHERSAIGYIKDNRNNLELAVTDSIFKTPGIFRTSDIKCNGKHYTTTSFSLKDDQINYKSRENSFSLPRYSGISFIPFTFGGVELVDIDGPTKQTTSLSYSNSFCGIYSITQRKYDLYPSTANFVIHKKISNYYFEDYSYKTLYGFDPINAKYGSGPSLTAFSSAGTFDVFTTQGAIINPDNATTFREILCSRAYATETSFVVANLSNFYETDVKKLLVYRAPFYTNDGNTVFRYFEATTSPVQLVPSQSGHGFIKYFTISDIPELNTLIHFNLFGTDSIFFICTPTYTVVFTLTSSTFVKFNTNEDFSKAQFYSNANGEFFLLNGKIFKYNSTLQQIIEQTLVL